MTNSDYRSICISCAEMRGARESNLLWDLLGQEIGLSYLLYESENFVVIPGAGAIVPGYSLIIPREHILSMGFLPSALDNEFVHVLGGVVAWLQAEFGLEAHVFEHGAKSFREKGGACADHAHTQVAPLGPTNCFVNRLQGDFATQRTDSYLDSAREIVAMGEGDPYLYTHSASHAGAIATATGAKGQYFRRLMAAHVGRPDEWDGPIFPHIEHILRTLDAGRALPNYL
jgi:diadenosine tetraphosphate (Ap4A) HIT family hydrolase